MNMTVLEAAAMALAGDGQCCGIRNEDGSCCMIDRAREVFAAIESVGGPSLEQCEALARAELSIVPARTIKKTETSESPQ